MRLSIFEYGEPILRAKGKRIDKVDDHIRKLATNMLETMQAVNGVGLAAQQVGEAIQLTVLDVSPVEDRPSTMTFNGEHVDPKAKMPLVLINPRITLGAETEVGSEGCLSFPDITGDIERAESVIVHAETLENEKIEIEATGLLARAIQHEIDHLNGILFVDRMNSATKVSLASRLKRLQKETKRGRAKDRRVVVDQSAL
jgi:peptide deformylase